MYELTAKQKNKIKRALKSLEEVRKEVDLEYENKVQWYLEDCGNLNLMEGESHEDGYYAQPRREAVIASFNFKESSGGGW